jgi:hypothetical protein
MVASKKESKKKEEEDFWTKTEYNLNIWRNSLSQVLSACRHFSFCYIVMYHGHENMFEI